MDNLASSITQQFHLLEQSWFGDVVIMTSISFVAWIAWRILYGRIETLASKTTNRWDDAIVHALKTPISALIWGW